MPIYWTYIQYMRYIHRLGGDNRTYRFLCDFEQYKMHQMRKGYVSIMVDNLFCYWKERSHIFHSRHSLNRMCIQLRHRKSKDFLAYLEGRNKQLYDTLLYILLCFRTKYLDMDLYIPCLYTVYRMDSHCQWCIRLQKFWYILVSKVFSIFFECTFNVYW